MAEEKQKETNTGFGSETNYTQAPKTGSGNTTPPPETGSSEYTPKISFTEMFFIGGLYALSDVFAFIITPLGLSSLISLPRAGASQLYFYFKKMGTEITVINWVTGAVTGVPEIGGVIPSVIGWGIIVFVDRVGMARLNEIAGKVGKVGELAKKAAKELKNIK